MMLRFLFNALLAFACLAMYGYVEKNTGIEGTGTLVSGALCVYLVNKRGSKQYFIAPILLALQIYLLSPYSFPDLVVCSRSQAAFAVFLLLISQLFLSKSRNLDGSSRHDDVDVQLRPYEREIRAILMTYDHGKLHTVDTLLQQNAGYESVLLQRLKDEYNITSDEFEYQGSPLPTPKSRGRSRSPLSPVAAAPDWDTNQKLFQEEIRKLVENHEPQLLKHLPAMFNDYIGREEELLKLLYEEFNLEYVAPAHTRRFGQGVAPVAHHPDPLSSPFASRSQTILEMARKEAREEIQKNLRKRC